jgi:ribosomal protein S10
MSFNMISNGSDEQTETLESNALYQYASSQYEASVDVSSFDRVEFSAKGKAMAQLDSLLGSIDQIYSTYLTDNDISTMENIYTQISTTLSDDNLSSAQLAQKDTLFDKVDQIMQKAKLNMESDDLEKLQLLQSATTSQIDNSGKSLEQLADEQEELIESKLTAKEKKNLDTVNQNIKSLINQGTISANDNRTLNVLYESLNNIIDRSYDRLSSMDKNRVDQINEQITKIEKQFKDL